jgi:hypothetical protein
MQTLDTTNFVQVNCRHDKLRSQDTKSLVTTNPDHDKLWKRLTLVTKKISEYCYYKLAYKY